MLFLLLIVILNKHHCTCPWSLWWDEWWPPNTCPCPNPLHLWILPYLAKDAIKLKILREGTYPGLSGWALNAITCILAREGQREIQHHTYRREGNVKRSGEREREAATSQGTPTPTRTWKRQGTNYPQGLWREHNAAYPLISKLWSPDLWESKFLLF